MKTVADILPEAAVGVTPDRHIGSVIETLLENEVDGVPVHENDRLVGMVFYKHVVEANRDLEIARVMEASPSSVPPTITIREAADIMLRENVTRLPVVGAEGAWLGVITTRELLNELRRPRDPLTELPMADSLREWAMTQLENGREITILFLDVNDFGLFNKRYGHVVGDKVLKAVADLLSEFAEPELDFLSRYGGDEFCFASLRTAADTADLARRIGKDMEHLSILDGLEKISISFGQRGGRRTVERDDVHLAATVNSLINLASQDCLAKKQARKDQKN